MPIQKKIRFFIRFLTAVFRKQYRNILFGILLGFAFYFLSPFALKYIPKPRRSVKIGIVGHFTVNEIPEEILKDISKGLTTVSNQSEVLPSIAESWEFIDEGKTYKFKVGDKNLYWQDGQKFSPLDVNYNFKDVVFSVEGDELIFKLKDPFSAFPSVVSKPLFRKGLIGIGDYKVKKIVRSGNYIKSILLEPFDKNNLPLKYYKIYPTENDLKIAFNLGEINFANNLFNTNGIYKGSDIAVTEVLRKDAYLAVFFDTSKPPFQEKTFRQALAYAILKETGDVRALTPINPLSWAYNPDVKPYNLDIEKAKKLLESEKEALKNIKIVISTLPQYEKVAESTKLAWEKIGVVSEVQFFSFVPSEFDVLLIAREIPLEPDQYYYWHSTQAGNLSNFKNPRIDKLLEDGRKTFDKEERKNIYFDFQRFLNEESPAIFLTHPISYSVTRNSVLPLVTK